MPVRRRDADAAVADDAERRRPRSRSASAGAPREAAKRARPERSASTTASASSPVGRGERALRELERVAHARTPTCTSRKRAGAAPCDTCACCPGCPLPQFVSPCSSHSSGPATRVERAPEDGRDPGVGRVAQHPAELAVLDLPRDLRPELEVEPLVVDRPALVRLEVDALGRRRRAAPRASPAPGSRWRFVIRTSGIRLQPSARIEPPPPAPICAAVSREVRNPRRTPSSTIGSRRAGTPSSSQPKVPSPRGVVESAVMFMCSEP